MPIYSNFEGQARAAKTQFFAQNFPKWLKRLFIDDKLLAYCFKIFFACDAKIGKKRVVTVICKMARKINSVDLQKMLIKFSKFGYFF